LAFGYGIAVGGAAERRADFAAREWKWGDDAPEPPGEQAVRAEITDASSG
jgi:hypothetical protein